jgi:hypothetical protein
MPDYVSIDARHVHNFKSEMCVWVGERSLSIPFSKCGKTSHIGTPDATGNRAITFELEIDFATKLGLLKTPE